MNRTSRLFLMGSGFVLAAGLGTGLVAYYGGGLSTLASAGRSVGPDELKYVPEAAAVVAYANVRDVMNSEFRQKIRTVLPDHDTKGQEEFQRETGINIEQDIDYVLAWMTPRPRRPRTRAAARSAWSCCTAASTPPASRPWLPATAASSKPSTASASSVRIPRSAPVPAEVEAVVPNVHDHIARHRKAGAAPMVAFLEPGLIALGEEPTIRAAIAHGASGGRTIRDNQEIVNLIGDLEGSSNVWAVGRMDALTSQRRSLPEPLAQHLPAVKWFSASSHVGAGVSGLLRAEARDDEAAKNLRDVLQGFMAMAKLHAGQKPELAPVMQSLQVSGTGTTVALSFEVQPALVDALDRAEERQLGVPPACGRRGAPSASTADRTPMAAAPAVEAGAIKNERTSS